MSKIDTRNMTRAQAVSLFGEATVARAEAAQAEPTNRVTGDGTTEFCGSVAVKTEYGRERLCAYYYLDADRCAAVEDLGDLEWSIDHYSVE